MKCAAVLEVRTNGGVTKKQCAVSSRLLRADWHAAVSTGRRIQGRDIVGHLGREKDVVGALEYPVRYKNDEVSNRARCADGEFGALLVQGLVRFCFVTLCRAILKYLFVVDQLLQ